MTIRHLKTFIKVCECESITKAANELCIAQPSVTQTIKELEFEYNISLFDRINQRLILTEEGKELLQKAREVVEGFDEFETLATDKIANPVIRIGATLTFSKNFVPKFYKYIKEIYPDIKIFFDIDKTTGLLTKILKGEIDFALCEGITNHANVNAVAIKKVKLLICSGPEYNVPNEIKIEDIPKYNVIVREPGSSIRQHFDEILKTKNVKYTPFIESVSNFAILSSLRENVGIGLMPYPLVKDYLKTNELREINIGAPIERNLYAVTHKNKRFVGLKTDVYRLSVKYVKEYQS